METSTTIKALSDQISNIGYERNLLEEKEMKIRDRLMQSIEDWAMDNEGEHNIEVSFVDVYDSPSYFDELPHGNYDTFTIDGIVYNDNVGETRLLIDEIASDEYTLAHLGTYDLCRLAEQIFAN